MPKPTTLFFDIGGVLLTNGWDTPARQRAAAKFQLEEIDFQKRHGMVKTAFETGRMSIDTYLAKTVFYIERPFSRQDFIDYIFTESKANEDVLNWLRTFAKSRRYRIFALNNESRELHEYRKERFKLDEIFEGFLTSCYLGSVKPDEEIYLSALGIASCRPNEAIFVDDRPLNLETADALGIKTVHFTQLALLLTALKEEGIET